MSFERMGPEASPEELPADRAEDSAESFDVNLSENQQRELRETLKSLGVRNRE